MFQNNLPFRILIVLLFFTTTTQAQSSGSTKKYQSIIKKAESSQEGFISVHMGKGKLWLEIPEEIMGRDLLLGSRVEQLSSNSRAVAGQMMHNPLQIRFSHDKANVYMHKVDEKEHVRENDAISKAFERNKIITVMQAFKIEAFNPSKKSYVVDVTKFFNSMIELISPLGKGPGRLQSAVTKTIDARAYDKNVELVTRMGFDVRRGQFMCLMHRSIYLLPEKPMRPRLSSPRIGYYDERKKTYTSDKLTLEKYAYIKRWRLEPKPEDIKRHKQGKLVEPQKPIVFYVDNAFPEKWRKYIKAGIEDWQAAFEAIGFKNAIIAKDYPEKIKGYEMGDFTKSCFRYVTTEKANAQGNSWIDPRSGEIIQGDVLWYHGVFNKLYLWRFAQTAANDPAIRGKAEDVKDEVLGELVRYAAAHEIGHSLGLKHNYRASYAYPVDSLRSPTFTQRYGTAASIMDYARNNYIAQPKDKNVKVTPPILGVYDYFSIKWAYKPIYSAKTPEEEKAVLDQWVAEKSNDDMYLFGTKNGMGDGCMDPSVLTESLGNDVIKAGRYGVKNAKLIMKNLVKWTGSDQNSSSHLRAMYDAVLKQYRQYIKHAEVRLGGVYEFDETTKKHPKKFKPLSKKKQKEAVNFILGELLTQYEWMNNSDVTELVGSLDRDILKQQARIMNGLVDRMVLVRITSCANMSSDPYTTQAYLRDISKKLFNAKNQSSIGVRNLQVEYVRGLLKLREGLTLKNNDLLGNFVMADVMAELDYIDQLITPKAKSGAAKNHFNYLKYLLK